MAKPFGHEKLIVYQKGMRFVVVRSALVDTLSRRVAACDHLDRGAESILVNIAHASSTWSPNERIVYLGHANGSSLECAACLDVLVAKKLLSADEVYPGKCLLAEVVSMLISMRKTAANRICEDHVQYRTKKGRMFDHEDLDVYQIALQLVAWVEPMLMGFSCSADLRSKLDKSTTAIVLNIAEGNGRFSGNDQAKFYKIAYKATVQSASLVDLATINDAGGSLRSEDGRDLLRRIAAMLAALSKTAVHDQDT
ncbi:MAG: four helix bundle protein [Verrucomicrobia bacterium]|nr:four helix bundle protein [Verrucomicrobiota bacterium]